MTSPNSSRTSCAGQLPARSTPRATARTGSGRPSVSASRITFLIAVGAVIRACARLGSCLTNERSIRNHARVGGTASGAPRANNTDSLGVKRPSGSDAPTSAGSSSGSTDAPETARPARERRRWVTWPRALAGIIGTAVVGTLVARYLPSVVSAVSPSTPVQTTVVDFNNSGIAVILPRSPLTASKNPGDGCQDFQSWADSQGGVGANETPFFLLVQGNTSRAVYVEGMRARVLSVGGRAGRYLATCQTQGPLVPQKVALPLDGGRAGRFVPSAAGSPFGVGFTIGNGESETFSIAAKTRRYNVHWLLEVQLIVAGHPQTLTVSDHGRPFVTSATPPGLPDYAWNQVDNWILLRRPAGSSRPRSGAHAVR
jgi:hypothetical protein